MYAEVRSVGWMHRAAVVRKDGRSYIIMINVRYRYTVYLYSIYTTIY